MSIVAIQFPTYQPAMRIITAITNAFPALVTTSFPHQYITGLIVRLYVPYNFGMVQANHLEGAITVTSDTQFKIDIDTTNFSPFVIPAIPPGHLPAGVPLQYAQVVPVGEINAILAGATKNVLPYVSM